MKFSKEAEQRILAALAERLPEKRLVCPLCKHENWILTNGWVPLRTQESWESVVLTAGAGQAILAVALSCTTCGNTHLLNVLNLGLRDLFTDQEIVDDDIPIRL
jgi:hypothetical protein